MSSVYFWYFSQKESPSPKRAFSVGFMIQETTIRNISTWQLRYEDCPHFYLVLYNKKIPRKLPNGGFTVVISWNCINVSMIYAIAYFILVTHSACHFYLLCRFYYFVFYITLFNQIIKSTSGHTYSI